MKDAHDSSRLLQLAQEAGFELAGVCDAVSPPNLAHYEKWLKNGFHGEMQYLQAHLVQKKNPAHLLPEVQSILAVGLNYHQKIARKSGEAKVAQYALGRDYHKVLRSKLKRIASKLLETHPYLQFRICVDSAPILERDFAQLAGLGWYGKNTLLINSERGSWFVIGLLLLSERFEPSSPALGGCGTCRKCIDACPTGAIVPAEGGWQIDARKCISYRTIELKGDFEPEQGSPISDWTFGCDVCQDVCPFNQARPNQPLRAKQTVETDFLKPIRNLTLVEVKDLSYEDWDFWSRGSPVRRAGYEGIRRNAAANLGNLKAKAKALQKENES